MSAVVVPNAAAIAAVSNALALVHDAIAANEKSLIRDRTPEEERSLRRQLAALQLLLTHLREDMNALIAQTSNWPGPTPEQRDAIGSLMDDAEELTTANLTASRTIGFASRVLALGTEIATLA
jgi:hypothetical protein